MGGFKKTRKDRRAKMVQALKAKVIKVDDGRLKRNRGKGKKKKFKPEVEDEIKPVAVKPITSSMFFNYNTKLGPPYHILVDTNFLNFTFKNKLDLHKSSMDCLYAKTTIYITDCVMAELEKLGHRFRLTLKLAKDPRIVRLTCLHKGTYADDCLVERVTAHKCYIVATCDKAMRRRIRLIPGVPVMYISKKRFTVERMPDAFGAPKV